MNYNIEALKQKQILEFWRNVEIFNLPDFNNKAIPLELGEVLPWTLKKSPIDVENVLRYTIFFGRIEKKVIVDQIDQFLVGEDNKVDWEESISGNTCLSVLILDQEGRPDKKSYVTASYAFGLNAVINKQSLSQVPTEIEKNKKDFELRFNISPITEGGANVEVKEFFEKGDVTSWNHLNKELAYLKVEFGSWQKEEIKIFYKEETVHRDSNSEVGFFNSFFLGDLNYLCNLQEKGYSKSLRDFLKLSVDKAIRKDVILDKYHLFNAISPKTMQAGRWPSKLNYNLYTAQLGAINDLFSEAENESLIKGINGPPGTGKTTLLLDVISEVIVRRAKVLARLGCENIFDQFYDKIEKEKFIYYSHNLKSDLRNDFGIVIASNNNSAVENITKEIPSKEKIDYVTFSEADYFKECSGKLIDGESWSVLAAALGKKENRTFFKNAIWKLNVGRNEISLNDLLGDVYKNSEEDSLVLNRHLFEKTKKELNKLHYEFNSFIKIAEKFHNSLPDFINAKKEKFFLKRDIISNASEAEKISKDKGALESSVKIGNLEIDRIGNIIEIVQSNKPFFFFFHKLFGTDSFRQWKKQADIFIFQYNDCQNLMDTLKKELVKNEKKLKELNIKRVLLEDKLMDILKIIFDYEKLKKSLNDDYGIENKHLLDEDFYVLSLEEIHLRMPYSSPKIAKLRSDIFIKSLDLHKYAILFNAKKVRGTLNLFFAMILGDAKVEASIAQNLWDTFFLCIPVASTSLASVSKLFPNRDKNQIGWLLIDEAGQATPQSTVGIIQRSKRCVIVGDPLQVEPVVTIPANLVTKLRLLGNIDLLWSPLHTSAQQLADRISVSGTYMKNGSDSEPIWTGFPLRTHRRCDDPMFSIANKIAYGDQMVKAVRENSKEGFIGPSQWFHVEDTNSSIDTHVIKKEIDTLKDKITELHLKGYTENIYIISPFKSVANACQNEFRKKHNVSCGTVHKFQGKEADIVFLVLGSDPKSVGARNWASKKPNILNVALTRAKKRLYVIGNKTLWGQCDYYKEMLELLM